jgi:hypothetical protein
MLGRDEVCVYSTTCFDIDQDPIGPLHGSMGVGGVNERENRLNYSQVSLWRHLKIPSACHSSLLNSSAFPLYMSRVFVNFYRIGANKLELDLS